MGHANIDLSIPFNTSWRYFQRVTQPIVDAGLTILTAYVKRDSAGNITAFAASKELEGHVSKVAVAIDANGIMKTRGVEDESS